MPKKKIYLYNAHNKRWLAGAGVCSGALLTFPVSSLYRTQGCIFTDAETKKLLAKKNIGKKFDIEFLDPVRAKGVRFCGRISKKLNSCLPKFIYAHMKNNEFFTFSNLFFVFKKGRDYIVVNTKFIEANLVH